MYGLPHIHTNLPLWLTWRMCELPEIRTLKFGGSGATSSPSRVTLVHEPEATGRGTHIGYHDSSREGQKYLCSIHTVLKEHYY